MKFMKLRKFLLTALNILLPSKEDLCGNAK